MAKSKVYKIIPAIFPSLWCCQSCGAAIWDRQKHDTFDCVIIL